MNVKGFEKKEKNTAELTVMVSAEEFEAAVNKAYLKGRSKIAIPGFRKGKAPRKIIEGVYGTGAFYEDAVEDLYNDALTYGVQEEKLEVVGRPTVLDVQIGEDKSCTYKFLVSLYPEVKLGQYKGIAAPKPAVRVLKKDVDLEIEKVREKNARIQEVDRKAKKGDIANIDFEGFIGDVAFEGGKGEGYDLELGSGTFIPGFEDQVIGAKAGDAVDVNVTFPEAYAPELAGKDATFKVKVNEVKEKILPELDDEFAKDVSEFDTLEAYTASVKEQISEKRKADAQSAFEEVVLSRLVDSIEVEIPDAMIEDHVDNMLNNFGYNLAAQGINLEQYAAMMGMTIDSMKDELRPTAEKELKADLAFEAIVKAENFEIGEDKVAAEYLRLASTYNMTVADVEKAVPETAILTGLRIEEAKKLVFSTAVAEKKEKKTEEKTEE